MKLEELFILGCLLPTTIYGFYLPGVQPHSFERGEPLEIKVNSLTSPHTQLPYEYYSLPFCRPEKIEHKRESLGEILSGQTIESSPYDIKFGESKQCSVLCRKNYNFFQTNRFVQKIRESYIMNWILDNMPAAYRVPEDAQHDAEYFHGFPLGGTLVDEAGNTLEHFIFNHHRIIIKYHLAPHNSLLESTPEFTSLDSWNPEKYAARIVGLDVEPFSVKHTYDGEWSEDTELTSCATLQRKMTSDYVMQLDGFSDEELGQGSKKQDKKRLKKRMKKSTEVIWTYDVLWEYSDTKWASRWDIYLSGTTSQNEVHWFAIVNSLLIVMFLSGMVGMILLRTLRKDLSAYNAIPTEDTDYEDEKGWKLVHADVFRAPRFPMFFSVTIGSGIQSLFGGVLTLIFAFIGFLSPAKRGSLLMGLILMWMLMGVFGGYFSARVYKAFNGKHWQKCTLLTSTFYPSIIAGTIFLLNLVVWAEKSSNAIPFGSMVVILLMFFAISVPLTFLGAFYGYKKDVVEYPTKTGTIPRAVPEQPWYLGAVSSILMGGILPFGSVFIELFFILNSLWMDQFYAIFGFLCIVVAILVIVCAEITIVLVYFQLCGEDYYWRWRSLLTSGACAMYTFGYSVVYFSGKLEMDSFVSVALYTGYMGILSLLLWLATSVVGFMAAEWFVVKIYSAVKVD